MSSVWVPGPVSLSLFSSGATDPAGPSCNENSVACHTFLFASMVRGKGYLMKNFRDAALPKAHMTTFSKTRLLDFFQSGLEVSWTRLSHEASM